MLLISINNNSILL